MDVTMQLTIDCADPQRLVDFWCEALGYVPEPPPDGHINWRDYWTAMGVPEAELPAGAGMTPESIIDPAGRGPRVWFQRVPEPKVVKNRLHLDLKVSGGRGVALAVRVQRVNAMVERLTSAGATTLRILDEPGEDHFGVLLCDPEGNEFCVA
ncbi:VOC family protein [Actinomadura violacea]|uniref:VOC family protein n=1 Tax=Actinomadura violacea TaxID=2819934 RepID=UPI001E3A71EF|nr:VOC family protein [Actinomadura violacea]